MTLSTTILNIVVPSYTVVLSVVMLVVVRLSVVAPSDDVLMTL
jgi:hypothetical protein